MEHITEHDDLVTVSSKRFQWLDRLGCIEELSQECADNGNKLDQALKVIRLRDFSINAARITIKQKTALRRDVTKRVKEIQQERESADIGDIVRVPKLISNVLGGYKRDGRRLIEAKIIGKYVVGGVTRYQVQRLTDGGIQHGNGHMIKSVIRQADCKWSDVNEQA